jgi:hypothetical protein
MNMRVALAALVLLVAAVSTGCGGPVIALNSDRYMPQFDASPLANYRGRALVMRNFENADENTTIFVYPRSGPRRYGGPVLTSYFWYCFRTAFERLGVRVYEEGQAPANLPMMDVRLLHLDESGYTVSVRVLSAESQSPLQKQYSVPGPPVTQQQAAVLEARAYQMTTTLFWEIVTDPQFQAIVAPVVRP